MESMAGVSCNVREWDRLLRPLIKSCSSGKGSSLRKVNLTPGDYGNLKLTHSLFMTKVWGITLIPMPPKVGNYHDSRERMTNMLFLKKRPLGDLSHRNHSLF